MFCVCRELTDDMRRILAWPSQWEEYSLGDYGPGINVGEDVVTNAGSSLAAAKL